jgi:hypothetical protein
MTLPSKTIKTQWFRNSNSKQLHRSHETAQCQSCLREKKPCYYQRKFNS